MELKKLGNCLLPRENVTLEEMPGHEYWRWNWYCTTAVDLPRVTL